MVTVKKAVKDYTAGKVIVHALRGVDILINKGEFMSIAGPSGSGKTTLLNLIGCLDVCTSGDILIENEHVGNKNKIERTMLRRKKIGFVFQSFNLIPVLTAFENIAFSLSLLGLPNDEIRKRTMKILDEVGLGGLEKRFPREMSGGQQQRVAIARALVKNPALVLADEPTANLDSTTGKEILKLMEDLNKKHESTFIFSTHDAMVMDFAHRLVLLHDGVIVDDKKKN
ncbi:MAG: ABC transporter ATP-binding protein [Spirochaetaceae bacterium]|nr:MAG: ABC transporter ATP-binding protein [Spirochaetaceae bacterium]